MHLPLAALLLASAAAGGEARPKLLGAQVSAGAPQGFELSVALRPVPWLRATGGVAHNLLGPGVLGSLTALPFRGGVTPTLTFEGGKYFETDVSGRFRGSFPKGLDPALAKFGYVFLAALAGVELGSPDGLLFFVRGGVSWVRSGLADVSGYRPEGSDVTVDVSNPRLRATTPTLKLGLVLSLW